MSMPLNQFLTELHQRAVKDGIQYCFLHDIIRHSRLDEKTQSVPEIIISNDDVPKILSHIAAIKGVYIIDLQVLFDGYSFAVYGLEGRDELKTKRFIIRTQLLWSGAEFSFVENVIDRARMFEEKSLQLRIAHPMDQTVISFFYRFLKSGHMQTAMWPYWREVVSSMKDTAEKRFAKILGKEHGHRLIELIIEGNKSKVYADINVWRKHFFRQSWHRDGVSMLWDNCKYAFHHIKRCIVTDKQYIAFYGIDGAGKTTAVFDIYEHLKDYREKVEIRHLKPSLISPKAPDKGRVQNNPHDYKNRSVAGSYAKIIFYFLVYWADRLCPTLSSRLSFYDRFMPDMYVDIKRYRLHPKSQKALCFLMKRIPTPMLSVLLDVDPQTAYERKKELSVEEAKSQSARYHELKTFLSHHNFIDIDANQSPEVVSNDIEQSLVRQMAFIADEKRKRLNLL